MLDYTRKTAMDEVRGPLRRGRPPGNGCRLAADDGLGVVSHLRWVEWSWIQRRFLGVDDIGPWTDDEDPDREFHFRLDWPLADVVEDYRAMAREHDELIAGLDLDQTGVHDDARRQAADVALDRAPPGRGERAAQRPHRHRPGAGRRVDRRLAEFHREADGGDAARLSDWPRHWP